MSKYLYYNILAIIIAATLFGSTDAWGQKASQRLNQVSQQTQKNSAKANEDEEDKHTPKITVLKDQGLALGIDIAPFIMRIIKEENTGFAFIGRYGFNTKWWANGEVGFQNTNYKNDNFKYSSNGAFIKVGIDYDIFQSEFFPVNDNIFVGARYGFAWQRHEATNFTIVDTYWGNYEGSVSKTPASSHMLEMVFGLRCEMLKNFYMGWSVRARFLFHSSENKELNPYAVPGYGNYDTKAGIGFTYTLEYQIPFNKLGKKK